MPTPKASELYSIVGFNYGVDNLNDAVMLKTESLGPYSYKYRIALREAVNVDLTLSGGLTRRAGYSIVQPGRTTSLWSDERLSFGLCVRDGYLCRVDESGVCTPLTSVLTDSVAYAYVNGEVLWSDGARCGRVFANGEWGYWGAPVPPLPMVSAVSGDLTEGQYRVAVTCIVASGEESGCVGFTELRIPSNQAITVSGIPVSGRPDVTNFCVYCSLPFGEELYLSKVVDVGVGGCVIAAADMKRGRELKTLLLEPPSGAAYIRAECGRAVLAVGEFIIFSEPFNYGLFNRAHSTILFDSNVTGLEYVPGGWYVGTELGTYFIHGTAPTEYKIQRVDTAGVVPGTMVRVDRKYLQDKGAPAVYWLSYSGIFYYGTVSGGAVPLAAGRFKLGRMVRGASLLRQTQGERSVLFTLQRDNTDSERGIAPITPSLSPYEVYGDAYLAPLICST